VFFEQLGKLVFCEVAGEAEGDQFHCFVNLSFVVCLSFVVHFLFEKHSFLFCVKIVSGDIGMHRIKKTDQNQLIVEAYPLVLVLCVLVPLVIATVYIVVTDPPLQLIDGLIFYGVGIGFLSFHHYKKTIFYPLTGECTMYARNAFQKKESRVALKDIEALEMSFGRGSGVARGGVLNIVTKDGRHPVIQSDVQGGHERKTVQAQEQIENFLRNGAAGDN
jgi:hypothetical protein